MMRNKLSDGYRDNRLANKSMDEEKKKFKNFAIAAWKASYSLERFIEIAGHPTHEGEARWRSQYAKAGMPFGNTNKGFEEFVRTMPG